MTYRARQMTTNVRRTNRSSVGRYVYTDIHGDEWECYAQSHSAAVRSFEMFRELVPDLPPIGELAAAIVCTREPGA